jgi:hypothetical protein
MGGREDGYVVSHMFRTSFVHVVGDLIEWCDLDMRIHHKVRIISMCCSQFLSLNRSSDVDNVMFAWFDLFRVGFAHHLAVIVGR